MAYTILRFKKDKGGAIAGCERHNERKKEAYKSNLDIDINRTKDNYHIIQAPKYTYSRRIKDLIKRYGCKVRKDSVKLVETLITASPDFMNKLSEKEKREYFERATEFIKQEVGEDRIISAVVHMDESTPHMHLVFCPINKDGKLSAKSILGNQKSLSEWQTRFYECMHERVMGFSMKNSEKRPMIVALWLIFILMTAGIAGSEGIGLFEKCIFVSFPFKPILLLLISCQFSSFSSSSSSSSKISR